MFTLLESPKVTRQYWNEKFLFLSNFDRKEKLFLVFRPLIKSLFLGWWAILTENLFNPKSVHDESEKTHHLAKY